MTQISSVSPQHSAGRDGGEQVEIVGQELDAVTAVAFGPFEATIVERSADRLVVTAPTYTPGHAGQHGEVIVWVDTEPTRSGVVWTWEGKTLEQLGGPLDPFDQEVALAQVAAPQHDPADPVDQALAGPAPAEHGAAVPAANRAHVDSFQPTSVPEGGGTVTVHGHGFQLVDRVLVAHIDCQYETVSDTELRVEVPAYPGRVVSWHLGPALWIGNTPHEGDNTTKLTWEVAGDHYPLVSERTDLDTFHVQSLTPFGSETLDGGEEVHIGGAGFLDVVDHVTLGPYFRITELRVSPSHIHFRVPPWSARQYTPAAGEPAPPADVVIHTKDGLSAAAVQHEWTWADQTPAQLLAGPQQQ